MSIKSVIFSIHPIIRNLLLPVFLIFALFFYFLQEGIGIDSLKVGRYQVKGLYLKLDKKLVLKIDHLVLPQAKRSASLEDIDGSLKRLKGVLRYFESINLDNIEFTNDHYRMVYEDNTIYISNDNYEIAGMITLLDGGFRVEIPLMCIKKYDLILEGKLAYTYASKRIAFKGIYSLAGIDGSLSAALQDQRISFSLTSQEVDTITPLLDMLKVQRESRTWIDQKVSAERYQITSFSGKGFWRDGVFYLSPEKLHAKAKLKGVTITLEEGLKPVKAKASSLLLDKDGLYFELDSPYYGKKSLEGSRVALLNIINDKDPLLLLRLKFHTQLDSEILRILRAYDISMPIRQLKGQSRAEIKLDLNLDSDDITAEGRVFISKGVIKIGDMIFPTDGGEVTFTDNRVALWNVKINDKWYRGTVNGHINLDTEKAKLTVDLKRLCLGGKEGASLTIGATKKLPLEIDFSKKTTVSFPTLNIKIKEGKGGDTTVSSHDIKPLLPYVKGLPIVINSGKFSVATKDHKRYSFNGVAEWKDSYFYNTKGYLTSVPFQGLIEGKKVNLTAFDDRLDYKSEKALIKLKDINIDIKKINQLTKKTKRNTKDKLQVLGKRCKLRYGKKIFSPDSFNLKLNGKKSVLVAKKYGDSVHLDKNGNAIVVSAHNIKDKMLRSLIHFKGLRGGRYSVYLQGDIEGKLSGSITIKGGVVDNFKAYNGLIALINTLPALMTLSDPGFSKKGFVVRDGKIEFEIIKEVVYFKNILINGKSSTIAGRGMVELGSGRINIDVAIRTAREIGKVLGSLPVVGYILFGRDKSFTTGVKISGTLDRPKVKVNPVKEALLFPLELIKRTLTSPAHIINK